MTDINEIRKIIENAPKGCTHHAINSNKYFMIDGWRMHVWLGEVWSVPISNELDVLMVGDVLSLDYIRTIVEQAEEIKRLTQQNSSLHLCLSDQMERIAELEQANDTLYKLMVSGEKRGVAKATEEFEKEKAILKLEQQAKGLEEMLDVTDTWSVMNTYAITVDDIYEQMQELRKQAAKLKEQRNDN